MSTNTDRKDETGKTWDHAPMVDSSAVSSRGRLHYDKASKIIKTDTDSRTRAEEYATRLADVWFSEDDRSNCIRHYMAGWQASVESLNTDSRQGR